MRESLIESKCCQWAKAQGWLVFKFVSPNNRGVPDRLFIKNGCHVFVEFKSPGKHPTALQQRTADKMRKQGATVYVIDSVEDFINVMS